MVATSSTICSSRKCTCNCAKFTSEISAGVFVIASASSKEALSFSEKILLFKPDWVGYTSYTANISAIKIISDKSVNFQSGYLYHYAFVMLVGFSILLTYLILY